MKYLLIICTVLLLTGCIPIPVDTDDVTAPAPAVTDNCGWYKLKIESLESRLANKEESIANLNNQALRLSGELQTAQLALGIQKALHEKQLATMTELINKMSGEYVIDTSTITAFNEQYLEVQKRLAVIADAFAAVDNKAVRIQTDNVSMLLSDNLTQAEYKAFYKGWDLWWWTFNERDGGE